MTLLIPDWPWTGAQEGGGRCLCHEQSRPALDHRCGTAGTKCSHQEGQHGRWDPSCHCDLRLVWDLRPHSDGKGTVSASRPPPPPARVTGRVEERL